MQTSSLQRGSFEKTPTRKFSQPKVIPAPSSSPVLISEKKPSGLFNEIQKSISNFDLDKSPNSDHERKQFHNGARKPTIINSGNGCQPRHLGIDVIGELKLNLSQQFEGNPKKLEDPDTSTSCTFNSKNSVKTISSNSKQAKASSTPHMEDSIDASSILTIQTTSLSPNEERRISSTTEQTISNNNCFEPSVPCETKEHSTEGLQKTSTTPVPRNDEDKLRIIELSFQSESKQIPLKNNSLISNETNGVFQNSSLSQRKCSSIARSSIQLPEDVIINQPSCDQQPEIPLTSLSDTLNSVLSISAIETKNNSTIINLENATTQEKIAHLTVGNGIYNPPSLKIDKTSSENDRQATQPPKIKFALKKKSSNLKPSSLMTTSDRPTAILSKSSTITSIENSLDFDENLTKKPPAGYHGEISTLTSNSQQLSESSSTPTSPKKIASPFPSKKGYEGKQSEVFQSEIMTQSIISTVMNTEDKARENVEEKHTKNLPQTKRPISLSAASLHTLSPQPPSTVRKVNEVTKTAQSSNQNINVIVSGSPSKLKSKTISERKLAQIKAVSTLPGNEQNELNEEKRTKTEDEERLEHRGKVVQEILSSERVFHGLLLDFLGCYYVALSAEREQASMDFMSRSSLVGLCSNIEQISAVSGQMLSELSFAASVNEDSSKAELGEVFLCLSSLLKLYGQYAENHSAARHDIRLMVQSAIFRSFWDRTETDAMLGRNYCSEPFRVPSTSATLDGYLILPIQRVPRYLLLLKELLKATPKDAMKKEFELLERAIEEVDNAAKFMNECIWRAEQKEILRDLQSKFVGTVVDFIGGVGLAGYRALIMEGELIRVTSKNMHRAYHFHLMNDALVYSRANGSGGFRFHRALSLNGSCSVAESPSIKNQAYEIYTNDSKLSCAFKICTPEKSFVVYASTPELKRQWFEAIECAIKAQANLEEKVATELTQKVASDTNIEESDETKGKKLLENSAAPTLQSATDKCQMCRKQLFIFTRRLNCARCGLLVCGVCGSNQRVLPGKLRSKQLRMTLPVCCACAWEMDGTAVDASVDEFRLKVWVDDVQSLVGGVGGHAILESTGEGGKKVRHNDAVEALKRLYFSLSVKHRGEDIYRGPSNSGVMGPDASFAIPIGLPSDETLPQVTLHIHMVGVGEIGKVPIRVESIILQPEVARAQPFYKWHVVSPMPGTTAISTLAVTLIQSVNGEDAIHSRLSEKERSALRIGLKVCFELHVPPSLWGAHFYENQRQRTPSTGRVRTTSVSTNRPGASKAVNQTIEIEDDVAIRLKRYMSIDDPAFTIGGTNIDLNNSLREKLNVSLLTEYEKRVVSNPTKWGLILTDTLYSDCLAHYGALAKNKASQYSDTQLTLLNRLKVFHKNPVIINIVKNLDQPIEFETLSTSKISEDQNVLLQAAKRQASLMEERRPSKNIDITRKALLAQNKPQGEKLDEDEEEDKVDEDDRETILRQLFETEKLYLESLVVLDEVFVSRIMQVAQGADIRLATLKRTDVWAEKMGLAGATPTMTVGIQAMNTGVIGRAKSLIQKSPAKMKQALLTSSLPANLSNVNEKKNPGTMDEDEDIDDVTNVLRQPFVTVLMQSVKQIRTVNQEFYNSLSQRLNDSDAKRKRFSQDVCVGDIFERFAGVMPVYSTYASHHPFVLEELTLARTEDDGWDARWSLGARANSKSLDTLLTACEADPRCAGRDLKVFLSIPLERVETYRAALSALLMCTPRNHQDWNRMRLALGKIVESTKHMTRAIRRRENLDRLREIEASVEDWPEGFQLIDSRRWLVREGCLIERQTFAKRETHRARYFWLFSDCVVMATKISRVKTLQRLKSWGSSEMLNSNMQSESSNLRKYRFKRLINIGDMTICDLPHGVQSSQTGLILGDPFFAFCIASVSSQSFVVLVPNSATDCCSKAGPAPVELARVGPPPTHSIMTTESKGRPPFVYDKALVKSAWISDILLCIDLFQRKAVFDDDEGIQQYQSCQKPLDTESKQMQKETRASSEFAIENPVFSPVKPVLPPRRVSASSIKRRSAIIKLEQEIQAKEVMEKEEF